MKRFYIKIYSIVLAKFRAVSIFLSKLPNATYFDPLSKIDAKGILIVGSGSTLKKGCFFTANGEIRLGNKVWLNHDVEISSVNKVLIGNNTTIQRNTNIHGTVTLGESCLVASNVYISSFTHVFEHYPGMRIREQERKMPKKDLYALYNKPITIGDDVWLGVNSVIMPGVIVASHAVVGANSVVCSNVPYGAIVAGVPAKIIRIRKGFEEQ